MLSGDSKIMIQTGIISELLIAPVKHIKYRLIETFQHRSKQFQPRLYESELIVKALNN